MKSPEWQKLTFQEIEVGMLVWNSATFEKGKVVNKFNDCFSVMWGDSSHMADYFPSEAEHFDFSKAEIKQKKNKVLSKQEIYGMLLSESVSLKAVRKIEKVVLDKLRSEDDSK